MTTPADETALARQVDQALKRRYRLLRRVQLILSAGVADVYVFIDQDGDPIWVNRSELRIMLLGGRP